MSDGRSFDLHDVRLSITSEDAHLARLLTSRLRHFARQATGRAAVRFDYVIGSIDESLPAWTKNARPVYDVPAGVVLYDEVTDQLLIGCEGLRQIADFENGAVSTTLASSDAATAWTAARPLFTIALLEQMKRRGMYGVHAALLARNGRALVIPGTSGAGKTTLTLSLLRAGFGFGGDDLCFLAHRPDGLRLLAFPDEVDVAAQTVRFFPELEFLLDAPRPAGALKWPMHPESAYPTTWVAECEPCVLVFPRIGGNDRSTLERISPTEALLELVPNVLLTAPQAAQEHLDALGELVRQSRCWRLSTGRDFDTIPELLGDLMESDEASTTRRRRDAAAAGDTVRT